jgi:predicted nucleic acid-binding protein
VRLVLDTGILGQLCHPKPPANRPVTTWLDRVLERGEHAVILPEIADYELRRKLVHLARIAGQARTRSLDRLDLLGRKLTYLPVRTETFRRAAELWAGARMAGMPTAPPDALDGDVLLAAQASEAAGIVVTRNRRHLERYVQVKSWEELAGETLS